MSEYNIQMNKYNALNAEYDQLYPATKIENVDGLDTALQNKADLGEDGKVSTDQLPDMGYSKPETLSDTTKTLFGLDANAVPDDVLTLIKNLIDSNYSNLSSMVNSRAKIVTGFYVGTGTYGSIDNKNSLPFKEEPFLVFLYAYYNGDTYYQIPRDQLYARIMMMPQFLETSAPTKNNQLGFSRDGGSGRGWKSADGKTIYWYSSTSAIMQYNKSGERYYYMAIYK